MSVAWGCVQVKVRVQTLLERADFGEVIHIDAEMAIPEETDDDRVFPEPVRVKVTLSPTGTGILARGEVAGLARQTCARCLQRCDFPVQIPVLIEYRIASQAPRDSDEDVEDWFLVEGEYIDLLEPIRQHLLVALPMKPLCDEDCAGLERVTQDEEATPDPRMQALAELRKKIEEQEKGG